MMKTLTLFTLLLLAVDPRDIGKINEAKAEAQAAYQAGNYEEAVSRYRYLVDDLGITEDEVMLNLASSYFHLNDTTNAITSYQPLTMSPNNKIRSVANQQIGVLNNREGKFEEALNYLKQSIKADPANDDARYNYEMIKKKLAEQKQKDQDQKDQNKDQKDQDKKDQNQKDQKDQQNQDQKDQQKSDQEKKEQEKKDQEKKDQENKDQQQKEQKEKEDEQKEDEMPSSVKDKLNDLKLPEDKARMILDAMKDREIQYLQQNKRKATKPKDRNKPDW